jgi:hypothetical protein
MNDLFFIELFTKIYLSFKYVLNLTFAFSFSIFTFSETGKILLAFIILQTNIKLRFNSCTRSLDRSLRPLDNQLGASTETKLILFSVIFHPIQYRKSSV